MKITGFHIDGFGLFHDTGIETLPPGLSVVLGANEAGKSTLLAFLRAALFGFSTQAKVDHYAPLRGGKHAGRLFLEAQGNSFVLERRAGARGGRISLTDAAGVLLPDNTLQHLLDGATDQLYRQVYAFGLDELRDLDRLDDDDLRAALYGAGAGTAAQALSTARKRLDNALESIYLPRGKNTPLNQCLSELDAVRKALKEKQQGLALYNEKQRCLYDAQQDLEQSQQKLASLSADQSTLDNLVALWPIWIEYTALLKECRELPESLKKIDINAELRLNELLTEQRQALGQQETLKREGRQFREEADALIVDADLLDQGEVLRGLMDQRSAYQESLEAIPLLKQRIQQKTDEIHKNLHKLGPDWTEAKIEGLDRSIISQQKMLACQKALRENEADLKRCQDKREDAESIWKSATEEMACLQAIKARQQEGEVYSLEDVHVRQQQLQRWRYLQQEIVHQEERLLDQQQRTAQQAQRWQQDKQLQTMLYVFILAGAVVFAVGMVLVVFGHLISGGSLAGIGFVLGILLFWMARQRRKVLITPASDAQDSIEKALRDAAAECAQIEAALTQEAISDVEALDKALEKEARSAEDRRQLVERLRIAEERAANLQEILNERRADVVTCEAAWAACLADWEACLQALGLSTDLSPETAGLALELVDETVRLLADRTAAQETLAMKERTCDAYVQAAQAFYDAVSEPCPPEAELPSAIAGQRERYDAHREALLQREGLHRQLQKVTADLAALKQTGATINDALAALLSSGDTDDPEIFRQTVRDAARRNELLSEIRGKETTLCSISGETDLSALVLKLNQTDLQSLQTQLNRVKIACEAMKNHCDEALKESATLETELKQLQHEESIAAMRAEEEALRAACDKYVQDWRRYALAKALLDRACAAFEKEQQPEVIRDAAVFFERFTGGRYKQLVAPIGEKNISVISARDERKDPKALSRGTAEQLYLALRFGFIRHRGQQQESLPVLMDDILVNFDPQRAAHTVEAIAELARDHQILFFTCHPETVQRFQAFDAGIPVYSLEDGDFTAV